MTITKIKARVGKKVDIKAVERTASGNAEKTGCECEDVPLDSLYDSMAALAGIVCDVLDYPEEWQDRISVRQIEIEGNEVQIEFSRVLEKTEERLVAKTPWFDLYEEAHVMLVARAQDEAGKYLNGIRKLAQIKIGFPEGREGAGT